MQEKTSVALGSFDGVHRGHQAVLQSALSFESDGLKPVVLLFDRHPLAVLRGAAPPALLEEGERVQMLREMGFAVEMVSFDAIHTLPPDAFVQQILCDTLHAGAVSCGFNYRFGKDGAGDADTLRALCSERGIRLHVSEPVCENGVPVSSTTVRSLLEQGEVERANAMLGRPFSFTGTVVHGNENGRAFGFPTANTAYPSGLSVPRFGVYATDAAFDGKTYRAITNIGVRPTLSDTTLLCETHIPGQDHDLYGKRLTVSLRRFIRPEKQFASLADVFTQVRQDLRTAYPTEQNGESL